RLDRLETVFPRHHQAQRRAVLLRQRFAIQARRQQGQRMHGLVYAQALAVRPVDRAVADAGHLLWIGQGGKGHVLRFRGRLEALQHLAQRHAGPRDHHGPAFHAAQAVDPLLGGNAAQQVLQPDRARLRALAINRHRPGRGAQGLRRTRWIVLVGAELVEVVVGGDVLVAGRLLAGAEPGAGLGGGGAGRRRRRRFGLGASGQAQQRAGGEHPQEPAAVAVDRFVGDLAGGNPGQVAQAHGGDSRQVRGLRPRSRRDGSPGASGGGLGCARNWCTAAYYGPLRYGCFMTRAYNFSAGPATLPEAVLRQAQAEMLDWNGTGASIVELSHRGAEFMAVAAQAEADLRTLMSIPDDYAVLFLAGGATTQQALIALNFAAPGQAADYVVTGHWSKTAIRQVRPYVDVHVAASSEDPDGGFRSIPPREQWQLSGDAAYVHITANETIHGVEYHDTPDVGGVPLFADFSSSIASEPIDVSKYGLIYAGAQKNLGPVGISVLVVRRDLLERAG